MVEVIATRDSVKRQIDEHIEDPFTALNEYIWNGIDAGATKIGIKINHDNRYFRIIEISDNGSGIEFEKLSKFFGEFNNSPKNYEKDKSLPRGEKGYGRFSFIKFASEASWSTIYKSPEDGDYYGYSTSTTAKKLVHFSETPKVKALESETGTKVTFTMTTPNENMALASPEGDVLSKVYNSILLEFCWLIEPMNIEIKINDKLVKSSDNISKRSNFERKYESVKFDITFIKWAHPLTNQSSRFYFLDSKGNERYVTTTKLNNKGDTFDHSVYVKSSFFDDFHILQHPNRKTFRHLIEDLSAFLRKERRPFMETFSKNKLKEFQDRKLMPAFNQFDAKVKKPIYEGIVRDVIEFAPSLVTSGNDNHKRILLALIYRLIDDEKSRTILYEILETLVDENNRDLLEDLKEKLRKYGLRNILGTIKLIDDRIQTIESLKKMMSNKDLFFIESDLQRVIEDHFWIFGEEYNLLVGAEEDNFNKLRDIYCKQVLKLTNEEISEQKASRKEVDLFICGIGAEGRLHNNLIVEIKKPNHNLTLANYYQLETYKNIIKKMPEFNTESRQRWTFILLYTDLNENERSDIEDKIADKLSGITTDSKPDFRMFIVKWFDLLEELEFKLKYLKAKLEEKRKKAAGVNVANSTELMKTFENSAVVKK